MTHVYPVADLRPHDTESTTCECGPTVEWADPKTGESYVTALVVHNSFDGRERDEQTSLAKVWITYAAGAPLAEVAEQEEPK